MDKILAKLFQAKYFCSSVALRKLAWTPLSCPFSSDFASCDSKFQVCYATFVSKWHPICYVLLFFTFCVSLLFNFISKVYISFALREWFPLKNFAASLFRPLKGHNLSSSYNMLLKTLKEKTEFILKNAFFLSCIKSIKSILLIEISRNFAHATFIICI